MGLKEWGLLLWDAPDLEEVMGKGAINPPEYCRTCGQKLVSIPSPHKFNQFTGKAQELEMGRVCPDRLSTHDRWYWEGGYK